MKSNALLFCLKPYCLPLLLFMKAFSFLICIFFYFFFDCAVQFENFTENCKLFPTMDPPRQESFGTTQPCMNIYTALADIWEVQLFHPSAVLYAVQGTPKKHLQKAVIHADPAGLCGTYTTIYCKPWEATWNAVQRMCPNATLQWEEFTKPPVDKMEHLQAARAHCWLLWSLLSAQ